MAPELQVVNLTQNAIFTCNATGYNVSYFWTIGNKGAGPFPNKVTDLYSNTLVIPNVRSADAKKYCCNYRNNACTRTKCSTLIVKGMYVHKYTYVYVCIAYSYVQNKHICITWS